MAFIRDITEQRNNQAQLQQKTIELERSNTQLKEFASIASHDLKEPLRKIILFSNIITSSSEPVSAKTQFHLQKIEDAALRMCQLVDGILSYSVVETGGQKERCSLETIFEEVLTNLESRIKETNAVVVSDGLPEAEVIPLQMQQLFQNLISNALKFSKKDVPPYINITHTFNTPEDINGTYSTLEGQYLTIKVKDNGIGFRMDVAENIFGLFKRLHSKATYEGSGLGLAICRKIAENHGGSITAYSEEGAGSTFTILFPLHQSA